MRQPSGYLLTARYGKLQSVAVYPDRPSLQQPVHSIGSLVATDGFGNTIDLSVPNFLRDTVANTANTIPVEVPTAIVDVVGGSKTNVIIIGALAAGALLLLLKSK